MIKVSNINKIQEVRVIHALSDLNIDINIDKSEEYKFSILRDKFNMSFNTLNRDQYIIDYKNVINIDHSKPVTSILSISKPLIYSKKIPVYLKNKWTEKRPYKFSFSGLITSQRKIILEKWINTNSNKTIKIKGETFPVKMIRKINNYVSVENLLIKQYGDLFIWSSSKGRMFPNKTWDKDYYDFLLKSKYVLCPSGDYIWTYRFFEAIMCGAIPVVEETCESYHGFKFYMMSDKNDEIKYDKEIVDFNFELLIERLTITQTESKILKNKIIQLTKNKCH